MLYIHYNQSPSGKWCNTFLATLDFPTILYLGSWQYGQISSFAWIPLNNVHLFLTNINHIISQAQFLHMLEVSCSKLGKVLGVGNVVFFNRPNNSIMNTLEVPCVRQQFNIKRVTHKLDVWEFSYSGILAIFSNSCCPKFIIAPSSWDKPIISSFSSFTYISHISTNRLHIVFFNNLLFIGLFHFFHYMLLVNNVTSRICRTFKVMGIFNLSTLHCMVSILTCPFH